MELTINVDALDKTASAVESATDLTALDQLQLLVLGNNEPLTLSFVDEDGAVPAWVTDSSTGLAVGLGQPDVDGGQLYTSTTSFTISGNTRLGTLSLNTSALRSALFNAIVGGRCGNRNQGLFTLEIRKTTAAGNIETLALLPVYVSSKVLTTNPDSQGVALPYGIVPIPSITSLTGGGATALDGIITTDKPAGYTVLLSYSRIPQTWQLYSGTDAENTSATPAIVRPDDYASTSNEKVWVQLY